MPPKRKPAPKRKSGGKRARSSEASSSSSDSDDILAKLVNKLEGDDNIDAAESSSSDATFQGDDDDDSHEDSGSDDDDDESVASSSSGGGEDDDDGEEITNTTAATASTAAVKGGSSSSSKKNTTTTNTHQHHPAQEVFTMRSVAAAGSITPSVALLATENAGIALSVATARASLLQQHTLNTDNNTTATSMRMLAGNNTLDTIINKSNTTTSSSSPASLHQQQHQKLYLNAAAVEGSTSGGWGASSAGALGAATQINLSMTALGGFTAYQTGDREGPTSSLVAGVGYGLLGTPIPGTAISSNQLGALNLSLRQTQHNNNNKEAADDASVSVTSSNTTLVNAVGPALPFTVSGSRLDSSTLRSHQQKQAYILDVLEGKQSIRNISLMKQSADSATSNISTTLDHSRVQDASYLVPQPPSSSHNHHQYESLLRNKLMMDGQIFPLSLMSNGAMFDVFASTLESTLNSLVPTAPPSLVDDNDGTKQQSGGAATEGNSMVDCHTILNDTLVNTLNELTRQQSLQEKNTTTTASLPSGATANHHHPFSEPYSPFARALIDVVLTSSSTDLHSLEGGSKGSQSTDAQLYDSSVGGGGGNGGREGADGGITSYASVRKRKGGAGVASEHEDELFSFFDSDGEDNNENPSKNKLASQHSARGRNGKNIDLLANNNSSQQLVELPKQHHMRSFLDRAEFLRAAEEAEFRHALFIEQRNKDAEMRALRRRNNGE